MLKTLNFVLLIFFIIFNFASATVVEKIEITGNKRVSSDTVILFGEIDLNKDLSQYDLNKILKNLYNTNFFKNIKIEIVNNTLNIQIEENPIIQSVKINGIKAEKIKEPILKALNLKDNNSYNEYQAKSDKDLVINILKNSGYYFAKVQLNINYNDNNSVDLIYNIDLGNKAKIRKIKFIGDKKYKNNKLFNVIVSEENKFWKFLTKNKLLNKGRIDLDKRLLKNFYKNKGFYNVKIESSFAQFLDDGKFDLVFNINAGEKFFFDELDIIIPDEYDRDNFSKIENLFSELKGEPYSFNSIEKILDQVELIALNQQYESINATVDQKIAPNNKINFSIYIDELKREYIERINIIGNNITREEVIRNELVIDEGDAFNKILHKKSLNNLQSLNFFKTVNSKITEGSSANSKIIEIEIEEKPTGEISAGAGVGTSGGTISFGVVENNFLGRGIEFGSNLELTDESIRGLLSLNNPNFQGSEQSLIASLQSSETDRMVNFGYKTTKTGFNIGSEFEYYEDLYITPKISSYYESLKTSSTASKNLKKQKGTYFDTDLNYSIDYDRRNQRFQPSNGFRSKFTQSIPLISDNNSITNGYEFNKYEELTDVMVGTFSFFTKSINSISGDDVRISERLFMPGNKLRGFERGKIGPIDNNDYVGGNYLAAINIAATLPNLVPSIQNADFSVFFDAGNIWGVDYDSTINDSNALRSAVGVAIDWYTPIGPLSFSLSETISKKTTDKTESFRFNLGTTF